MQLKNNLKVYITTLFCLIFFTLTTLLISINYQNSKKLYFQIAEARSLQYAKQIELAYQNATVPLVTSLRSLSQSSLAQNYLAATSRPILTLAKAIMAENKDVLAISIGYENETSAFIRTMNTEYMREKFNAPPNSVLQVELNHLGGKQNRLYFDEKLEIITNQGSSHQYFPTTRPWYQGAKNDGEIYTTPAYFYKFIQKMGISLAKKMNGNHGVIAIDISIQTLENLFSGYQITQNNQLLMVNDEKAIIMKKGANDSDYNKLSGKKDKIDYASAIENGPLLYFYQQDVFPTGSFSRRFNDLGWWITSTLVSQNGQKNVWLISAIPENELLQDALAARDEQIFYTLLLLLTSIALILFTAKKIADPLHMLHLASQKLSNLVFTKINIPDSNIIEIKELANSFSVMSQTISQFIDTLLQVSRNDNFSSLLEQIVLQSKNMAKADIALMWSKNAEQQYETYAVTPESLELSKNLSLQHLEDVLPELTEMLNADQIYPISLDPHSPVRQKITNDQLPSNLLYAWLIPMHDREQKYSGCIFLGFKRPLNEQEDERMYFIQAFLGFASLIKENWLHLQQQKKLFSSFVELIAAAIDTKSPYTGGHCQRVPELTLMLAEAAHSDQKYFADFELNENSREAIYLAAWLHDCGKVTTPEFVVDKSTKLETIYNRIHEIRTRFEVLKRDEEIRYWQHLHENVENAEELTQKLQQNLQQLDDDFAFIAKLNSGETVVKDAELTRLKQIAERVWTQTLDDSQGVSWEELQRKQAHTQEPLPRQIKLLDDSADLKITWSSSQQQRWQNWPFSMPIPKLQYNRGEVHNLSVERGTLTQEERFMINGHIVQTIELLNRLPYPTHLKRIPEIAGGHHERLDGKGYPYGLDKSQLTIDTRIIALADVFEALTAADRPYKSAKSLSNSLKILAKMANEQHIDKDLLKLFIEQKIYFRYAQMFLAQEQQDEVDEEALLATLTESDNSQAQ